MLATKWEVRQAPHARQILRPVLLNPDYPDCRELRDGISLMISKNQKCSFMERKSNISLASPGGRIHMTEWVTCYMPLRKESEQLGAVFCFQLGAVFCSPYFPLRYTVPGTVEYHSSHCNTESISHNGWVNWTNSFFKCRNKNCVGIGNSIWGHAEDVGSSLLELTWRFLCLMDETFPTWEILQRTWSRSQIALILAGKEGLMFPRWSPNASDHELDVFALRNQNVVPPINTMFIFIYMLCT